MTSYRVNNAPNPKGVKIDWLRGHSWPPPKKKMKKDKKWPLNSFFFRNHLSLVLVGERKQEDQAKMQFESKVKTPNQHLRKRGQKLDTEQVQRSTGGRQWGRVPTWPEPHFADFFKDSPPCIISYNDVIVVNVMHIKRNEAENFFSSPKNKTDFSKRRKNEKNFDPQCPVSNSWFDHGFINCLEIYKPRVRSFVNSFPLIKTW